MRQNFYSACFQCELLLKLKSNVQPPFSSSKVYCIHFGVADAIPPGNVVHFQQTELNLVVRPRIRVPTVSVWTGLRIPSPLSKTPASLKRPSWQFLHHLIFTNSVPRIVFSIPWDIGVTLKIWTPLTNPCWLSSLPFCFVLPYLWWALLSSRLCYITFYESSCRQWSISLLEIGVHFCIGKQDCVACIRWFHVLWKVPYLKVFIWISLL